MYALCHNFPTSHQTNSRRYISHVCTSPQRYSRTLITWTVQLTVLSEYFDFKCLFYQSSVCSIRAFDHNFVYKWVGFTYPEKFTCLNTFVIEVAQTCSDNGGPMVHLNVHRCIFRESGYTSKGQATIIVARCETLHSIYYYTDSSQIWLWE